MAAGVEVLGLRGVREVRPVVVAGIGGTEKRTRGAVEVEMRLLSVDVVAAELRARPISLIAAAVSFSRDVW